jgi:protein tyrosine/serine phosphatase
MGIKTIVDLRQEDDLANAEGAEAARLGLRFVRIPMSGTFAPSKPQVDAFKDVVNDYENYPIFVHCRRGADRTGALMAVYRMDYDGWGVKKAMKEMYEDGALQPLLIAWVYEYAYQDNRPPQEAAR